MPLRLEQESTFEVLGQCLFRSRDTGFIQRPMTNCQPPEALQFTGITRMRDHESSAPVDSKFGRAPDLKAAKSEFKNEWL